jgi:hypothetical protein
MKLIDDRLALRSLMGINKGIGFILAGITETV